MDRKAEVWKYILLIVAVAGQIIGFLFLFINVVAAFIFYGFYILTFITLLLLFIWDRKKEKDKEEFDDYTDY
ncbi:hypothetical protein [Priestia megaterium]|uniref:hypothetical protein n=1 Tax=Priestia megaterium TaxID=1404 RepID=UPI002E1C5AA1|nr:hypothetical protein [Priestia megaterium]MED3977416.1 hypothetical protein [Priestia megaterium]